ncbi:MAG: hypothetical protein JXR83_14080 [Deltaproteobacteria bacterium]|nr:hypothetical protein [Deltaproteobacteria bacterium]
MSALVLLLLVACAPPREPPPAVPAGPVAWSYIAAGSDQDGSRAHGFDGSVPAGAAIAIRSGGLLLAETVADARGRFDVRFGQADAVEIVVSGGGLAAEQTLQFAVRDLAAAREQAVVQRLAQTGAVPNHLLIPPAYALYDDALALVVNSGDNTVDNISLVSGSRAFPPLLLPEAAGAIAAQPFSAVAIDRLAVVTRFSQSGITLFEIASGQPLSAVDETEPLALATPFVSPTPVDADNDGATETTVSALVPRTLEGIAAVGDRLFVAAANLLQAGSPSIYAPGMVLFYDVVARSIVRADPRFATTAFLNPQAVVADAANAYVVESGVLDFESGRWQATSDGGVEIFDAVSLASLRSANLGRGAPGSAALSADGKYLYVGSLLRPHLYKIEIATAAVVRGPDNPIVLFGSDDSQSVFSLAAHPMGLVFASSFNTDQVFAIDTADDAVSPWPFCSPLQVGEGGIAFGGAQMLALRAGRNGVDFRGPDLAVLMSLAARIATIDTRYIMGP